jgi:hypothetical protein
MDKKWPGLKPYTYCYLVLTLSMFRELQLYSAVDCKGTIS